MMEGLILFLDAVKKEGNRKSKSDRYVVFSDDGWERFVEGLLEVIDNETKNIRR